MVCFINFSLENRTLTHSSASSSERHQRENMERTIRVRRREGQIKIPRLRISLRSRQKLLQGTAWFVLARLLTQENRVAHEAYTEKQTVAFNIKARVDFKSRKRARMGVWEAIELLNTLIDDSDPDVCAPFFSYAALPSADDVNTIYRPA